MIIELTVMERMLLGTIAILWFTFVLSGPLWLDWIDNFKEKRKAKRKRQQQSIQRHLID